MQNGSYLRPSPPAGKLTLNILQLRLNLSLCLLLVFCPGFNLLAAEIQTQELDREITALFEPGKPAQAYRELQPELTSLCLSAQAEGIPVELLLAKFKEGLAKRQTATQILMALQEEKIRLSEILVIIRRVDLAFGQTQDTGQPGDRSYFEIPLLPTAGIRNSQVSPNVTMSRVEIVNQLAIFSRSGLPLVLLEQLFMQGVLIRRPFLQVQELCRALINIPGMSKFQTEELWNLSRAVLNSRLSPSSYTLLPALFLKGNRYNLQYTIIIQIIITMLEQKGGLTQIEQEFKRRGNHL